MGRRLLFLKAEWIQTYLIKAAETTQVSENDVPPQASKGKERGSIVYDLQYSWVILPPYITKKKYSQWLAS